MVRERWMCWWHNRNIWAMTTRLNGKSGTNDIKFEVGRWKCGIDMHLPSIYNINCVKISKHIYTLSHCKAPRFKNMLTQLCYCHALRFQFTWTMDPWLIVYINAPYHHRLCITASNQIVWENRESKKSEYRVNLCVCLYQWWDHSQSTNGVFRSDKTKSLLLNPTMTLPNIITAIQPSIRDNDVTLIITALWYCCLVYQFNGHVDIGQFKLLTKKVFGACSMHIQIWQM